MDGQSAGFAARGGCAACRKHSCSDRFPQPANRAQTARLGTHPKNAPD